MILIWNIASQFLLKMNHLKNQLKSVTEGLVLPVQYPATVTVRQAAQQLEHQQLHVTRHQAARVPLQVLKMYCKLYKLENETTVH